MDELFKAFIATQTRIAAALEQIAANGGGGFVATGVVSELHADTVTTSDTAAADAQAAAKKQAEDEAAKKKAADDAAAKKKAEDDAAKKKAADDAAKKKAEDEAAAAAATVDVGYTIDEVRTALKEYRAIEGAPAMLEVLKTHGGGADSLPGLDAKYYPAIMEAVGASK